MNITDTIEPKVDQLTADHLVGRTLTIRITGVRLSASEQPCEIEYEGCDGLPYRPGKSMRRVLVHAWGGDVTKYVGRSMRLYRDDDVQFGGLKVGGIRISHMSDIPGPLTLALTAKKGSKKAFKVAPLPVEKPAPSAAPAASDGPALIVLTPTTPREARRMSNIEKWKERCKEAIAKLEDATAVARWRADMAVHFMAAEHVDREAVDHVQGVAQDRLDTLADAGEPA